MIQEASNKIGVVLYPLHQIATWCILATNSGGNARYWVIRDDNDEIQVIKLNKEERIDLDELLDSNLTR